jgi:hypothetical protein
METSFQFDRVGGDRPAVLERRVADAQRLGQAELADVVDEPPTDAPDSLAEESERAPGQGVPPMQAESETEN